ncbi:MAG: hypothetical protein SGARI_000910 [Bacillariaceae sp.]
MPLRNYSTAQIGSIRASHPYFTEFTFGKAVMYIVACLYVILTGGASILEVFLDIPCDNPGEVLEFENPAYDGSRCPHIRYPILMGLCKEECSCLFTINSTFAFVHGPMNWDASRISAAIPSGVGFLGAGLIFKKEEKDNSLVVHGLTTAASVWISASVGIACGGELYFAASFGVSIMMLLLRFGPRSFDTDDDDEHETDAVLTGHDLTPSERIKTVAFATEAAQTKSASNRYGTTSTPGEDASLLSNQDEDASTATPKRKSIRKRAALASVV